MAIFPENQESYKVLREALECLLAEQRPTLSLLQDDKCPLLVLETSTDMAGFAIVNGTRQSGFKSAYTAFKVLYRQRHTKWKERNLSFVVCRVDSRESDDAFFSRIANNVYFCRKYVVSFKPDKVALEFELNRLPFLPLPKGPSGGIVRPPPAHGMCQ